MSEKGVYSTPFSPFRAMTPGMQYVGFDEVAHTGEWAFMLKRIKQVQYIPKLDIPMNENVNYQWLGKEIKMLTQDLSKYRCHSANPRV